MPVKTASPIKNYYNTLTTIEKHGATNEGGTRRAFESLLVEWSRPHGLVVLSEQSVEGTKKKAVRPDGILVDIYKLRRGFWEAKDSADNLEVEITKKINDGYPLTNTLFENTRTAVLFQDGQRRFSCDLHKPEELERLLNEFVSYSPPQIEEFHKAVARFRQEIPHLAGALTQLIDEAKKANKKFRAALESFLELCRSALNPETTTAQVEDMLKQHILTERIFRSIFQNPDFVHRNAVAIELERMVEALTSQSFSRDAFLKNLDYFYRPIENTARTITDYSEKQELLKALYEQFFQAYSTKTADTHGIVYTPSEIVRWMVASVQKALEIEFGLGLEMEGVHIIDPCVGTGTFMMEILQQIPASYLEQKYRHELHANEIQLLPYYIAAQNIEHSFFEKTGRYEPFEGICFADTLDIMDTPQLQMFALENSERVQKQKQAPIRVVIGNPPYNAGQENENDNNKNRKHPTVDKRIAVTYVKTSKAKLHTKLYDPYVKFFRWATDRLQDRDGIVCFVSNNSFLDQTAFDGMRKSILEDFTRIYTFDLGGNVRKNPKLSGSKHNVFGIQVGVTITLLIRNRQKHASSELLYARFDEFWTKEQKLKSLAELGDYTVTNWQHLTPDARNTWLTEGMSADFSSFIPIGMRAGKEAGSTEIESIFKAYGLGVSTNRDIWVYDFDSEELVRKVSLFIETYNEQVYKWTHREKRQLRVDDFVIYDDKRIKWSLSLKEDLQRAKIINFVPEAVRKASYRPFTKKSLYFNNTLIDRCGLAATNFPTSNSEDENRLICITDIAAEKPFMVLLTSSISDMHIVGAGANAQCFPFYTYAEDGTNRRENITDWALQQFQAQYPGEAVTKWDIFYYVYAVLHSPEYRQKYAENLKRDLPRIPFVKPEAFRCYVEAGQKLATLHRDYEKATLYPLKRVENKEVQLNWRVDEKGMRLSPDKTSLRYNEWLTLANIPPKAFEYRLGNRSALDWVIDQYRVNTDARSGLTHDPNNPDEPQYIVRLVGQVVQVSLETLKIIEGLPPLS